MALVECMLAVDVTGLAMEIDSSGKYPFKRLDANNKVSHLDQSFATRRIEGTSRSVARGSAALLG